MAQKELVGTGRFVTSSEINLKIPVQQSYLPTQTIKEPSHDLPKDMVYNHDARNLHFGINLKCSDGNEENMEMGKQQMFIFFQQLQKIQDELNSYS